MLHLACQSGTHEALVQLVTLIEKQTTGLALHLLLQTDSQGCLPLHYAIAREQETTIFLTMLAWMKNQVLPAELLEKADDKGYTLMHRTILTGSLDGMKWLFGQNVSLTAQTHAGQNALHLAAMADYVEMLQLLLQQGMPLNMQDQAGNSALHLAAAAGSQTTLAALLRAGNPTTIKNKAGQTARECISDPATVACYDLVTAQLQEKATKLEIGLIPGFPVSSSPKAAHSSSGFGLFDEKKQAPAAQPVVDPYTLEQLLKFVAQGKQDEAEALIKKNPNLLLVAGEVTDLSDRTFDNITAFQYALWAVDYHMWTTIRKYLPAHAEAKQHAQLESKGTAHGKHFDLQPLLDALKTYADNYDKWNYDQREEQWIIKVGSAQKLLPAHVVNEYCRTDRFFDPYRTNWTCPLPRTQAVNTADGTWFNASQLGVSFAFCRDRYFKYANSDFIDEYKVSAGGRRFRGRAIALADFKNLQLLWNARTQQLKSLADAFVVKSQSTRRVRIK